MCRIPLITGLLLIPLLGWTQRISSQVTNLSGFDLSAYNLVVSVSIGEPAIATFTQSDYILTQGFLQPEILPCKEVALSYYPNPAEDEMTVELKGCDAKITGMLLYDPWGRLITTIQPTKNNRVYLGNISPGVYFLQIQLSNSMSETIKIAKITN
jgi:hypothetical protein